MPSTATQLNDLLQLAAQVGELSDRLKKAEGELASQSAPIGAAKSSQDAALTALASAVVGIKALNFHVIDKNVSEVRARIGEVAKQMDAAIKELAARSDRSIEALAQTLDETTQKLARTDAQRVELARKRDEDAKALSNAIALVARESAKQLAELSEQVQKFAERPGIRPSGPWGAGKTCDKGDLVSLNGSSYISLVDGNTEKPSKNSKKWQLIAARGGGGGGAAATGGTGDVVGPVSSTDNNIATFDQATGKLIQDGGKTIAEVEAAAEAAAVAAVATETQTLTNKRITPRITSITSSATPTVNTDNCDMVIITALAAAITSFTTNLSGTPTEGQRLIIRIKDDGTARAITWGALFASRGATLPTTTTLSKYTYVGLIYNDVADVWDCIAAVTET